jgi:tRNA G18 (ribose-2'-O)-methylase SpoU
MIVPIGDADDPRIADFRDVRERDLVTRRGVFIAEGEVVLRVLLRAGRHRLRAALIAEKRAARLAPLVAEYEPTVPVYVAGQGVMDAIAGFSIHRGVLALAERAPECSAEALLAETAGPAVILALFGLANHDNVGGVFRNAAAFGAAAVLIDAACCDPLYRKAIRVSVGGALTVPFARVAPGEDALALMERHGFTALALTPAGACPLHRLEQTPRAAVLLGAEGAGLPPDLLARAQTIAIPMAGGFDSLNVATASGIVLHHLATRAIA